MRSISLPMKILYSIGYLLSCGLLGSVAIAQTSLTQTNAPPLATAMNRALLPAVQLKAGIVENNVFVSLAQAGVPEEVALTMIGELSQAINTSDSIKAGDRFALLFEKPVLGGMGKNKLLAFEYTNGLTVHAAYWFDQGAQAGFYQENGVSLRPAYLRTPIEISRVSSNFGSRKHPTRKSWLTHEGTDFAAPRGTRVYASGDGEVAFIGIQKGFGKVIKLKHPRDTQTVYAHLSMFTPNLKQGDTVKQGEVIGFVGATGWATGPHLHYEYRVANKPIDPFSVDLPNTNRISSENTEVFVSQLNALKSHFALMRPPAHLASTTHSHTPSPAE